MSYVCYDKSPLTLYVIGGKTVRVRLTLNLNLYFILNTVVSVWLWLIRIKTRPKHYQDVLFSQNKPQNLTGLEFIDPTVKARRAGPLRLDTTQAQPLSHCPTEDKRIYTHNTQTAQVHRHFLSSAPSYGRLRPPRRTRRPGRRESRASRDVSRLYPVPTGDGAARW